MQKYLPSILNVPDPTSNGCAVVKTKQAGAALIGDVMKRSMRGEYLLEMVAPKILMDGVVSPCELAVKSRQASSEIKPQKS